MCGFLRVWLECYELWKEFCQGDEADGIDLPEDVEGTRLVYLWSAEAVGCQFL